MGAALSKAVLTEVGPGIRQVCRAIALRQAKREAVHRTTRRVIVINCLLPLDSPPNYLFSAEGEAQVSSLNRAAQLGLPRAPPRRQSLATARKKQGSHIMRTH